MMTRSRSGLHRVSIGVASGLVRRTEDGRRRTEVGGQKPAANSQHLTARHQQPAVSPASVPNPISTFRPPPSVLHLPSSVFRPPSSLLRLPSSVFPPPSCPLPPLAFVMPGVKSWVWDACWAV